MTAPALQLPPPPASTPILIAGAGPTGLALALFLRELGVDALVVEPTREIPRQAKGQWLSYRTMEHFARLGVAADVLAAQPTADVPRAKVYIDSVASGRVLATQELHDMLPSPLAASAPARLPQDLTQAVLQRHLGAERVLRGWRVTGFADDDADLRVELQREDDGATATVRAGFLVGCDGARSAVRKGLGAALQGDMAFLSILAVEFESADLTRRLRGAAAGVMYTVVGGARPCICSMTHGPSSWYLNIFGAADVQLDGDDGDVQALVFEAMGGEFALDRVSAAYHWRVHNGVADSFGGGRVFLAGDAAHVVPPASGLGLAMGVEDAAGLAWRLAGALQGWALPSALAAYERERAPWCRRVGDHSQRVTAALRRARASSDELHKRVRGALTSRLGLDLDVRLAADDLDGWAAGACAGVAAVGRRAPHVALRDGSSLLLRLRCGTFSLLGSCVARASAAAPVAFVDLAGEPAAEAVYGAPQVLTLVRPDGIIAWRGAAGEDWEEALGALLRPQ